MLERGLAAKKARSVFFEERNTIDIYIEDTALGYTKIYKCLLNRLLGDKFLINDVFPLGGKSAVTYSWQTDENKRNRPRLYIVDGDIDLINGERECGKGLYTLPYYCIENTFICENSIIEIMVEEDPEKESDELRVEFDFNDWETKNSKLLMDLFVTYALVRKFKPTIPNVNYQVSKLVSSNTGNLDAEKVLERINILKEELKKETDEDVINFELRKIESSIQNGKGIKSYVSGKDYLLPLIMTRLKSIVNTRISNLNFKHRISNKCDLSDLYDIEQSILH
ncbi:hypothetical protein BSU01_13105 [Erwinia billingiae]|uniref:DUF4435 domain-containing protein n=1 Tax=Erwinia billingiae TaxID=182337 RepID=UPI0019D0E3AA|nr:DUF4435 domain-containing protein [Erwinia billingiae]MBN7122638.1 hypothetical protein [Erwinia billingiae]